MNEIWKAIKGYEGLYEVSNLGRVKRVAKEFKQHWGKGKYCIHKHEEIILKPQKTHNGYLYVNLYKDHKMKHYLVHRLVAITFIKNDNNYSIVNHIDGNKTNNYIDNLEWCNQDFNTKEAYRLGLATPPHQKKIIQKYNGNIVEIFDSQQEASRKTGIKQASISKCLNKKQKSTGKYIWEYFNEVINGNI